MYCPKCGRCMTLKNGTLTCDKGNMPLSRHLHDLLLSTYPVQQNRASQEVGAGVTRLYCPSCGVTLTGDHICPACNKVLSKQILHNLIELHPHLTEDGQGWV